MKRRARPRVGKDGGFTIPKAVRESLGFTKGDVLELHVIDGELRITKHEAAGKE
jgi:AbrB family looped-hinge helix DNA binding protein